MTIAYRSSAQDTGAGSPGVTTIDLPQPSGLTEGDFMIAFIQHTYEAPDTTLPGDLTTPSGWTRYATYATDDSTNKRISLYYKFADATDADVGTTQFTFTTDSGQTTYNTRLVGALVAYTGVSDVSPFDVAYVEGSHFLYHTTDVTPDAPDVTTVSPQALVLTAFAAICGTAMSSVAAPSGFTLRESANSLANRQMGFADKSTLAAGAVSIGTWGNTGGSAAYQFSCMSFALRPEESDAPTITSSDTNPLVEGSNYILTGTNFEPGATDATLTWGGTAQTKVSSAATTFEATAVLNDQLYGETYSLEITNDIGLVSDGEFALSMIPANPDPATTTGERYVNVTETPATAGLRITATPDLDTAFAAGQIPQIHWKNAIEDTGGTPTAIDIDEVVIYGDGSISITTPGSRTFPIDVDVRVNLRDGEGWSAFVTQSISEAAATTPVLVGGSPVNYTAKIGVAFSDGVSSLFSSGSWTYAVDSGSLPTGISLNTGTGALTGTPTAAQSTSCTISATGAGGSDTVDVNFDTVFSLYNPRKSWGTRFRDRKQK